MVIRIPDSMFAQSTGAATAPGELDHETRSALAAVRSAEQEIGSLARGLTLAGEAMKGGEKARQKLAAARNALGLHGDSGALRWLLDHAAAEQARQETAASHRTGMRTLIGTIKGIGSLPIPFVQKAELGRALLQQGIEHGLVAPELHKLIEDAALSQFSLTEAQTALAKATEPGEALSIVAAAKAEGRLRPSDSDLLDRQAGERDAVATARHRARLAWKEQDDLAAFARGEQPEPLSEENFRLVHGAKDAPGAYARYRAARKQGEALAQIRGKDAEGIADAEVVWQGDPAVFVAARDKDAAERRRDPVAYVIATQPGLAQALKAAPPSETAWLLWQAQAAAGIPEIERSLWSRAQQEELADAWGAIPADESGRNRQLAFFRTHVQSLPSALRDAAIRTLVRLGITDGTEAELMHLVAELDNGRINPARALTAELTPAGTQYAELSDTDDSDVAEPAAETGGVESTTAPQEFIDWRSQGLPDPQTDAAWTVSAYEPARQSAIADTLERILALETDPDSLPAVEAEIRQRFAGDDVAIDFFTLQARTLARAEVDDPITGDHWRTSARDLVSEARDRVLAGEPYDERWAELRPTLARLETASGLRLRPGAGPGVIAVYEPGRNDPTFSLPLPLAWVLVDSPAALAEFTRLAGKLLRGEDISAELDALAQKFVETFEYTDEFGEQHRSTDASSFDEITAAVDGARARLAEGMPPNEVLLHLMQVVLAEELDDTDIAVVALEIALDFMPHYDWIELGINLTALTEALDAGDEDAAIAAGLGTALAAIGLLFPIIGDFAKRGLSWVGRKLGVLKAAKDRSAKRLLTPYDKASSDASTSPTMSSDGFPPSPDNRSPAGEPNHSLMSEDLQADSKLLDEPGAPATLDPSTTYATEELQSQIDYFRELGSRPGAPVPVRKILESGDLERLESNPRAMNRLRGAVAYADGKLGEAVVRPVAEKTFRQSGFDPFPKSIGVKFNGVEDFNVDVAGVRYGAQAVDPSLLDAKDVIQLEISGNWIAYRREDVRLADAKFGSAKLNKEQLAADKALRNAGHEGIEKLNPAFSDLPLDRLAAVLNRTRPFVDLNVKTSPAKLAEFASLIEKGKTTLGSLLVFIYLSELPIEAWLADGDMQDDSNDQLD